MTHRKNQPGRILPLYFADVDPQPATTGLAVIDVLSRETDPAQQDLWQAYFKLRGEEETPVPAEDFLPRAQWLGAAADAAGALPGGAVLADSLKKLAKPHKLPLKTLAAYAPELAKRSDSEQQQTAMKLAANALALWQDAWMGVAGTATTRTATTAKTPQHGLANLIWHLRWLEPHDTAHLPPAILKELKDLHLAFVLSQDVPRRQHLQGLTQAAENLKTFFTAFQGRRFNGLGEKAAREGFYHPHGYGDKPKGVFKKLLAESVWLASLPVYWQGELLTPDEQTLLARTRQESGLQQTLEQAMALKAYQRFPSASGFRPEGLNRKTILDGIINDAIQKEER